MIPLFYTNMNIQIHFIHIYGPIWCKYLDVYVDCYVEIL